MPIMDPGNPAHAEAERRLQAEPVIWLTTVNSAGQPQSTPVWFLWDAGEFLIYGSAAGPKVASISSNPLVSLHLDGDGKGGGNVIFEGTARIDPDGPRADAVPGYVAKYRVLVAAMGGSAAVMASGYPHVIRVTPTRARIW
ncbi:MAG: TIGR03667 family PPOX class F420-dependent oxidoreductase [Actinomycetota bacterium]